MKNPCTTPYPTKRNSITVWGLVTKKKKNAWYLRYLGQVRYKDISKLMTVKMLLYVVINTELQSIHIIASDLGTRSKIIETLKFGTNTTIDFYFALSIAW